MPAYLSDAQGRLNVRDVVFLLGAGASYNHGYPLVREFLSRQYLKWLCDQCAGLPAGFGDSSHALAEAEEFRKISENFEEVLSIAYETPAFYKRVLDYTFWLLSTAWDIVHSSDFMTTAEYFGLATLIFELSQIGRCSVITFNYDTAVEDAASSLSRMLAAHGTPKEMLYFNYGLQQPVFNLLPEGMLNLTGSVLPDAYPNSGVPVLKLHGSVTMLGCAECSAVYYMPMEALSAQWAKFISRVCKMCGENSLQPLIVPPGKRKKIPEVLDGLWGAAQEQLASTSAVIIAGYSMPEYDVEARAMLRSGLRGKDVLLIDPAPNTSATDFLKNDARANLSILRQTASAFLREELNVFVPGLVERIAEQCAPQYLDRDRMEGHPRA